MTAEDTTLLVARCQRPGQPMAGSFLLLLTNRQLVVTREGRLTRRVQLHLTAPLRDLSDVSWVADGRLHAVELVVTAPDRVRERFWIPIRGPYRLAHVDGLLGRAFRASQRTTSPTGTSPKEGRRSQPCRPPRLVQPAVAL